MRIAAAESAPLPPLPNAAAALSDTATTQSTHPRTLQASAAWGSRRSLRLSACEKPLGLLCELARLSLTFFSLLLLVFFMSR